MDVPPPPVDQPEPYRPSAPDRAALLRLPRAFGTRFALFVDTEEEFDWGAPLSSANRSVGAIAGLPDAHRRFADRGVPVTYLIDHPVADDPRAADILNSVTADGRSAIGAQLHPWVNPPFEEAVSSRNSFVGNLRPALQAAKIAALTDRIHAAFGRSPRVFRAGRYGLGPDTLPLIAAAGYRIDSSMRSRYDYSGEGGPDFRAISNHPFRTGAPGLVELPLTTVFVGGLGTRGRRLQRLLARAPLARGALARAGLLRRIALTPEDMPIADALEAVRVAVDHGVRLLNFSFHSPSLVPGHTPYVRDAADLAAFHAWWAAMFDLLERLGVAPIGEAELIATMDAMR
ncbi:polysaccharide deacetylase family protein [Sphingomonas sp. FW199]|uniref:polysaccharide deacetylase family protein n=1 Tax=Sphingomonas sp. FW199 TaxID=3400217 RepID=UPI003CFB5A5B